jgi:AcrR family transcriptional regulator
LLAAARVIAVEGLGAATATIAREAGVSNGSLFVYFDTKAALLNELYIALKTDMGAAATAGLPAEGEARALMLHVWTHWLRWAATSPEKRRALAQLDVSDEITAESHRTVSSAFSGIADLLERSRASGPLQDAPLEFVLSLTSAIADATIDAILREPAAAEARSRVAFDAMWRVLAGASVPAATQSPLTPLTPQRNRHA